MKLEIGNLRVETTDTNVFLTHVDLARTPPGEEPVIVGTTMLGWPQWQALVSLVNDTKP